MKRRLRDAVIPALKFVGRNIPFLGRLTFTHGVPWKRAFAETGVTTVLSSISIWIAAMALSFANLATPSEAANSVIQNGELYILASGTVSPLFYITLVRYKPDDEDKWLTSFPHGISYLLSSVVVLAIAIVFISVKAISDARPSSLPLSLNSFVEASWWVFLFSVFMIFTASVHKNISDSTSAGILRDEEARFGISFREHRDA